MSTLRDNWPIWVGIVLIVALNTWVFDDRAVQAGLCVALGAFASFIGMSFARLRTWPATASVIDWPKLESMVSDAESAESQR
jgi:hypothetical protein